MKVRSVKLKEAHRPPPPAMAVAATPSAPWHGTNKHITSSLPPLPSLTSNPLRSTSLTSSTAATTLGKTSKPTLSTPATKVPSKITALERSIQKSVFIVSKHIFMPINCGSVFSFLVSVAGSINTRVGVAGFSCEAAIVLDELEGVVHQPPFTALIYATGVTVNQLLLR
ncbi:hypothetical protein CMV_009267 [Castanea mollissima]|uniref:Uncharacterized protein n=1 Tax=Castanea mollissima TaxID=60419 RepID=A0A8J4RKI8_9ROSI|nr:hypothetical protein CMV_009267 [Castanea mollissima]